MPNADLDLLRGIGLVERYFRAVFREFFSPKTALFSFFTKNIVKFLCLRKEVLRIAYIYKKEVCDCRLPVLFQRKMQTAVVLLLSGQSTHGVPLYPKHEKNNTTQKGTT